MNENAQKFIYVFNGDNTLLHKLLNHSLLNKKIVRYDKKHEIYDSIKLSYKNNYKLYQVKKNN
jgi:hypothetical protein